MTDFPTTEKGLKQRISSYRRSLTQEKQANNFINDGFGKRYLLIPAMCRQRIKNIGQDDLVFLAICPPRFTVDAYEDLKGGIDDDKNITVCGKKRLTVVVRVGRSFVTYIV